MTLSELIDAVDNIACMDDVLDPEVYIQLGTMQTPVNGISYFPEIGNVVGESVVIGYSEKPNLIL